MSESRKKRIKNALWGLFAGDALAMPAHWFYNVENIQSTFNGGLTKYEDAPHPHPESFMVGMGFRPDIEKARSAGRNFDVLHEHARFYDTSYSQLEISSSERDSEHGNATPKLEERYHYHHGLTAGQNTVAAHLARVLLRSVAKCGRYDEADFLNAFIAFMTTAGSHPDPYLEIYLRAWFENYAAGKDPRDCAAHQRDVWSIGSHGGMIRPMIVSLLAKSAYQAHGFAIGHQILTHRSENVSAALSVTVPLLQSLLEGEEAESAIFEHCKHLRVPKLTGEELHQFYRDHKGPGNIPEREMWKLHTDLSEAHFDLEKLVDEYSNEDVILSMFGTVCYPEHGLPLLLFLAANHVFDIESTLLANANAGGDNVHRGAVLGLLLGAAWEEFPKHLKKGLADHDAIEEEIDAFAEVAVLEYPW